MTYDTFLKTGRLPSGFRLGLDLPSERDRLRRVLPFRRSWIVILIAAAIGVGLVFPALSALQRATAGWQTLDSLFDLTTVLFLGAWALGWSVGPLIVALLVVAMLFGREVLKARPGVVEIGFGLPGLLFSAQFDVARMRNLRIEHPAAKSGTSWRGPHLVFDYGKDTVAFGSAIEERQLPEIAGQIEAAAGAAIRTGEPRPEDLEPEPAAFAPHQAPPRHGSSHREPVKPWSLSTAVLIAANLVPIFGAQFLGWNLGEVMVLYWAESAVIGFYNLCKMAVVGRWQVLLAGPFFIGHFGAFMSVHFLFLYVLFIAGPQSAFSGDQLADVASLFRKLWPAIAALFVSHGISFFTNFLGRREYEGLTIKKQMAAPYQRIVFMHLVLIFGGGISMILGDSRPVLMGAICFKVIFDLRAHLKERRTG